MQQCNFQAARGRINASGANGAEGGEALRQLADRQASSSDAGPSHNSTYKPAAESIGQHSIPEGNPNLATLVSHSIIPFTSHILPNPHLLPALPLFLSCYSSDKMLKAKLTVAPAWRRW